VVTGKHKNIFQTGENGSALLRLFIIKSLNIKKWSTGINDYDECIICKQRAMQSYLILECWAMRNYASELFGEIFMTVTQLLPKKKHGLLQMTNLRLYHMMRFLRLDQITQLLTEQ
jgi:hypothetical protein